MTKVFKITPESNPEIWAMLQPPVNDDAGDICECVASEFGFPECQYIAHGCDLDTAIEFAKSWRRGEYLPIVGRPELDQVSRKLNQLNQMTNQPIALDK
ncbi:hypothetical protein NDI43_27495 [Microcoleus vaginatus GB2-A3]|uniref:hypothetical protein n=1 Tax=Microcoleus vaginatus TaxID=119532 RepID=UPI0032A1A8FD